MSKRKKYLISYESLDGETQRFAWDHYVEDDIYAANLIIQLNLVNRDDDMIFRVDKYYDEANNKNYQEFTKKEKQKAKERYQ
ncbi:hypothetical protein AB7W40_11890 [Providencia rettgeri]